MNEVALLGIFRHDPLGGRKSARDAQHRMAGQWNVTVSVKQNGKEIGQKKLTVTAK